MAAHVRTVEVPDADRRELERRVRAKGAPAREVERARIVLLAADGVPGKQIAAIVGCAEPTVVTWRGRYAERGLAGLADLGQVVNGARPGLPAEQQPPLGVGDHQRLDGVGPGLARDKPSPAGLVGG